MHRHTSPRSAIPCRCHDDEAARDSRRSTLAGGAPESAPADAGRVTHATSSTAPIPLDTRTGQYSTFQSAGCPGGSYRGGATTRASLLVQAGQVNRCPVLSLTSTACACVRECVRPARASRRVASRPGRSAVQVKARGRRVAMAAAPWVVAAAAVVALCAVVAALGVLYAAHRRRVAAAAAARLAAAEAARRRRKRRRAGLRSAEIDAAAPERVVVRAGGVCEDAVGFEDGRGRKANDDGARADDHDAAVGGGDGEANGHDARGGLGEGRVADDELTTACGGRGRDFGGEGESVVSDGSEAGGTFNNKSRWCGDVDDWEIGKNSGFAFGTAGSVEEVGSGDGVAAAATEKKEMEEGVVLAEGEDVCAVCLDELRFADTVRRLPCEHIFHSLCIRQWLRRKNACPCCCAQVVKKRRRKTIATTSGDDRRSGVEGQGGALVTEARATRMNAAQRSALIGEPRRIRAASVGGGGNAVVDLEAGGGGEVAIEHVAAAAAGPPPPPAPALVRSHEMVMSPSYCEDRLVAGAGGGGSHRGSRPYSGGTWPGVIPSGGSFLLSGEPLASEASDLCDTADEETIEAMMLHVRRVLRGEESQISVGAYSTDLDEDDRPDPRDVPAAVAAEGATAVSAPCRDVRLDL
jgi:Ring finger domain